MKNETRTRLQSYPITGFTPEQLNTLWLDFSRKIPDLFTIRPGRPPKINPFDSLLITIIYYRRNYTEAELAAMFDVSQSTINRIITKYSHLIKELFSDTLLSLEQVQQRIGQEKVLLDGTHITTSKHGYNPALYSGKHKTNGFNLQILANTKGELLYISEPLPGSIHDSKAVGVTGITNFINPKNLIADKGYIGTGITTPVRKNSNEMKTNPEKTKTKNSRITKIRYPVERTIAHLKNWKILTTRYRKNPHNFPHHLKTIITLQQLKTNYA